MHRPQARGASACTAPSNLQKGQAIVQGVTQTASHGGQAYQGICCMSGNHIIIPQGR